MQKPDRIKRDDICQTSQCTRFVTPEIAGNFECGCEIFMISCNQVVADLSLLMNNLKCVPHASGWLRYSATATHANKPKMTDYCHFSSICTFHGVRQCNCFRLLFIVIICVTNNAAIFHCVASVRHFVELNENLINVDSFYLQN